MEIMSIERLPEFIKDHYEIYEWRSPTAILKQDYPEEYHDIMDILTGFRLLKSDIVTRGGKKSPITKKIQLPFEKRQWIERAFHTSVTTNGTTHESVTHEIDCYRNRVAVGVEWNNKDTFFDRDLNNFRLLFELRVISAAVIITRSDTLYEIFKKLGKARSYGSSTTRMGKLYPRLEGGSGGGCPLLAFGITPELYVED